MTNQVTTAS